MKKAPGNAKAKAAGRTKPKKEQADLASSKVPKGKASETSSKDLRTWFTSATRAGDRLAIAASHDAALEARLSAGNESPARAATLPILEQSPMTDSNGGETAAAVLQEQKRRKLQEQEGLRGLLQFGAKANALETHTDSSAAASASTEAPAAAMEQDPQAPAEAQADAVAASVCETRDVQMPAESELPAPSAVSGSAASSASAGASASPAAAAAAVAASIGALRQPPQDVQRYMERFESMCRARWGQYQGAYAQRLELLRDAVLQQAYALWRHQLHASQFIRGGFQTWPGSSMDLQVALVGILFKEMKKRVNVVEQYRKGSAAGHFADEDRSQNLCSEDDVLWLEDGVQRVRLVLGSVQVGLLATGLVVAVCGRFSRVGDFHVRDVALPRLMTPPRIPAAMPLNGIGVVGGSYVAFISGLMFGLPNADSSVRRRAVDFLTGQCRRAHDMALSSAVKWLIICGGTFTEGGAVVALEEADSFLAELAAVLSVDLLPGHHDPTNLSMPQMPLHPHLFRRARQCRDFRSVTNPYDCSLNGLRVLGHAGQPVEDLLRCSRLGTPLDALTLSLKALHLAPTAPDTLPAPPCTEADPFVIQNMPHVLFSGGHDATAFEWHAAPDNGTGTLCLCVPAFHKQPAVVLVNMQDPRDVRVQDFSNA